MNQSLSQLAVELTYRSIEGVSIRFVESDPRPSAALLLSPWPESVLAYEPTWSRLSETTHLIAIDLPGFGRSERKDTLIHHARHDWPSPRNLVSGRASDRRGCRNRPRVRHRPRLVINLRFPATLVGRNCRAPA